MAKSKSVEIRAGIVVLIGLVVLATGMFLVSGGSEQFIPKAYYTILFENGGGIGSGDKVLLDGQKIGYVHDVGREKRETDEHVIRYVAVTVEIDRVAEVPVDSTFTVTQSITKVVQLEIESGKSPKLADADTELKGKKFATFEQTINSAKDLMDEGKKVVSRVDSILAKVDAKLDEVDVGPMVGKVHDFLDSLNRSGARVETILEDGKEPIDDILVSARNAVRELEALARDLRGSWPPLREKIDTTLANARDASGSLKGILDENRPTIRSFLLKLDDGANRVGPALETIEKLGHDLEETVVEVRPQLSGAIRSARKALENFEALTNDLKSAPWKLVNKPSSEEASAVLMFNAAQLYVDGAASVSKVVEDLDTLRRLGVLEDASQSELVEKLLARMRRALEEFDAHERKLVALLVAGKATGK